LEFKSQFNIHLNSSWCELIKDIVALANSDGGTLVIGLNNDGSTSGFDLADFFNLDVADIINRIAKYTGQEFDAVSEDCPAHPVLKGEQSTLGSRFRQS